MGKRKTRAGELDGQQGLGKAIGINGEENGRRKVTVKRTDGGGEMKI